MSTPAPPAPGPRAALPPPEASGLPWRGLTLLALAVLLVHLALLGLAPMATGADPSPLAGKFITRTIVVAPPLAPEAAPAAAPAPAAQAAPAVQAPRPRPRAAPRPRPAPAVPPMPDAAGPAAPSEASIVGADPAAQPSGDEGASGAVAAAGSGDGNGNGSGDGKSASGSGASGQIAGPVALQVPGSVRLAFAATAQRGAQPQQGVFGVLDWSQDGNHYEADLSWTVLFITVRSQHSSGRIGPTGIEPLRYADRRRSEVSSILDREQNRILFGNNAPSQPLMAGAQDRLSIVMQLGGLLAADPGHYPPGSVIAIQTVGPKDAEIWTFAVGDEDDLSLPAGNFRARRLTRNPRAPVDDKIELWLAPSLGWLPVRIRQTQPNGDFIDLQLRSEVPQAAPAPAS